MLLNRDRQVKLPVIAWDQNYFMNMENYLAQERLSEVPTKRVIDLIVDWLREYFHGDRLRDRLIFYTFFGFLLHLYVAIGGPSTDSTSLSIGLFWGLIVSFPIGVLVRRDIAKKIRGNLFYEPADPGIIRRILVICIALLISYLLSELNLPAKPFYQFFSVPLTLAFPMSCLIALFWLLRYEARNGPVYIQKETA